MVVSAPKDENELQDLLYTAIKVGSPMAIRYPRGSGEGIPLAEGFREIPIGKGEVLRRGKDLAILAIGSMVYPALKAAGRLSQEGISSTVVNARFVKPLDKGLILDIATQTKRLVAVEENALAGGFATAILELLAKENIGDIKVECLGLPDRFIEHGPQHLLRSLLNLDAEGICHRVHNAFPELFEG
jgi:1-deoxy-D-xylulose-5-phosphate synthase